MILIFAATIFAVWIAVIRPIDAAPRVMGDVVDVVVPTSSSAPTRYDVETAFQAAQWKLTCDLRAGADKDVIVVNRADVAVKFQAFKISLGQSR